MITQDYVKKVAADLQEYLAEVSGDDIMNGLIAHLIQNVNGDLTQLWFYGEALRKRKENHERNINQKH